MSGHIDDSPLTFSRMASGSFSFEDICTSPFGVFWTASRPEQKGRMALFCYREGKTMPLLAHHSVKARIHEYGGGAIAADAHFLYFISDTEKALMSLDLNTKEEKILYRSDRLRLAEISIHPSGEFLYMVGEDHSNPLQVENGIYLFRIKEQEMIKAHAQHDFYMSIALSKKGDKIAFIAWDHPHMSWETSSLIVCDIDKDGRLLSEVLIAASSSQSVLMPLWSSSGSLYFVSDKTGFWNIYLYDGMESKNICPMSADYAAPIWKLGRSFLVEMQQGNKYCLIAAYTVRGVDKLARITESSFEEIDLPFTSITHLVRVSPHQIAFFGAGPYLAKSVICYDIEKKSYQVIDKSVAFDMDNEWISTAEEIEFPSALKGKSSFAFYYPPKAKGHTFVKPRAVIVRAHGGPTGHNAPIFSLDIQFWTTRGFGFLDVNYSGSSGFGREYRDRLQGKWGIYDVEDCICAAKTLIARGKIEDSLIFIKGSSSGGYTALCAASGHSPFAGAVSYYGIADLESLTKETHKFELHYLDGLIGPYPRAKAAYRERSVCHHIDKIGCRVLLLQGKEDKVVLPSQAENMFVKLREKNIDAQLILFDNEGHGFRRAETIEKTLRAELAFYCSAIAAAL